MMPTPNYTGDHSQLNVIDVVKEKRITIMCSVVTVITERNNLYMCRATNYVSIPVFLISNSSFLLQQK